MISQSDWNTICAALTAAGFLPGDIDWAEAIVAPADADDFASELIFVVCNSGMKNTVARGIFKRVMAALRAGHSARTAFGHVGKAEAIDHFWDARGCLLQAYLAAPDKLAWLESQPWIGKVTKFHAAKNFGLDVVKPDVHLARLAAHHGCTPTMLCIEVAKISGHRIATIDTVLWRACAEGILDSRTGQITQTGQTLARPYLDAVNKKQLCHGTG